MSDMLVKDLARSINAPVETLIKDLNEAGVKVSSGDEAITEAQKLRLYEHKSQHKPTTITLNKRKTGTLNLSDSRGKKTGDKVTITTRRKKPIVKQAADKTAAASQEPKAPTLSDQLAKDLEAQRQARENYYKKDQAPAPAKDEPVDDVVETSSAETSSADVVAPVAETQPTPITTNANATVEPVKEEATPASAEVNPPDDAPTPVAEEPLTSEAVQVEKEEKPAASSQEIPAQPESPKQEPADVVESPEKDKPSAPKAGEQALIADSIDKKTKESTKSKSQDAKQANVDNKPKSTAKPKASQAPTENTVKASKPVETVTRSRAIEPELSFAEMAARRRAVAEAAKNEAAGMLKRRASRPKPVRVEKKPEAAPAAKPDTAKDAKQATRTNDKPKPTNDTAADKKKEKTFRSADKKAGSGGRLQLDKDFSGGDRRGKGRKKKGRGADRRNDALNLDKGKHQFEKPTAPVVREVEIPETIIVSELAKALAIQATQVIKTMMGMGVMATINQSIDQETAILIVEEIGHVAKPITSESDETMIAELLDEHDEYEEHNRPPVVTIMGHVDHGKTSLLDHIRKSRVVSGEAGGITQHIGAYHVETETGGVISFLDTPGHAAFTAMRARGAKVTDVVILVVAADDGVMPQTKEAIEHARAAEVPLVVAINKIDKPTADPDRVINELSQYGVTPEDWGGEDIFVRVSAHTGEGVEELLESILLVSEVLELKAPTDGPASGVVVEASVEKGRGAVATVMVQKGTLKQGDIILSGREYGRVRALFDENGKKVKSAGPSIPVAVLGLSGAPTAGDDLLVVADEKKAREIAEKRVEQEKDTRFAAQQAAKLDAMFSKMKDGERLQVPVMIKTDVQGSAEALKDSLLRLSTDEVEVRIISSGVGGINESDANLAVAANAVVVGFNVRADASARRITSEAGIEIRYYSIIYEVIDDVRKAMSGLLAPELREVFIGLAEVKDVFRASNFGAVAGCLVLEGAVRRGNPIRVLRENVVVFEGELESLRRHKDDVSEVISGTECGIAVKDYDDVQTGDQIECFERREVAREI